MVLQVELPNGKFINCVDKADRKRVGKSLVHHLVSAEFRKRSRDE